VKIRWSHDPRGSRHRAVALGAIAAAILVATSAALAQVLPVAAYPIRSAPPRVGFSFSSESAAFYGEDPPSALATLLQDLRPQLVRLPVYWEAVAPSATVLDFSSTDQLLGVIAAYNALHPASPARVVLVVGARNLGYPELHIPSWVGVGAGMAGILSSAPYLRYFTATVQRYRSNPYLEDWQVENEPFDDITPVSFSDAISATTLGHELALVRALDPYHATLVTSYNNASVALDRTQMSTFWAMVARLHNGGPDVVGHMPSALGAEATILGLDAYVVTPSTPLRSAPASERIGWKAQTLSYWAAQARSRSKALWVTEMQAMPWDGQPGFTVQNLLQSARSYRRTGPSVFLLWGVEYWLTSPAWLAGGEAAVAAMRATT